VVADLLCCLGNRFDLDCVAREAASIAALMPAPPFPRLLTLAGAIPFVAATAALWLAPPAYRGLASQVLVGYAAVILSFLGGIQWGVALNLVETAPKSARTMFMLSVVPSLLAWAMLLLPGARERVIVAVLLFAFVWVIDAMLHLQKLIPQWFFRLRGVITSIVVLSLLSALPRL
jgi:Protein of unknown function (DUF3429)